MCRFHKFRGKILLFGGSAGRLGASNKAHVGKMRWGLLTPDSPSARSDPRLDSGPPASGLEVSGMPPRPRLPPVLRPRCAPDRAPASGHPRVKSGTSSGRSSRASGAPRGRSGYPVPRFPQGRRHPASLHPGRANLRPSAGLRPRGGTLYFRRGICALRAVLWPLRAREAFNPLSRGHLPILQRETNGPGEVDLHRRPGPCDLRVKLGIG